MEKRDLFRNIHTNQGVYDSHAHIAEMIALLGHPPKELIDREKEGLGWNFTPEVENSEGKLCKKASEFYGGPFFDSEGNISATTFTTFNEALLIFMARTIHEQTSNSRCFQDSGLCALA